MSDETDATAHERALSSATAAWAEWRHFSREERARILRAVADALDSHADELVPLAILETHLPEARLRGELVRTTFQVRLFAETVERADYLDARVDHADPQWGMGPRPDLRRVQLPLGPVLVFTASNFPFAFSVMGGDTASALAAGCTVVVKGHPGHPRLSVRTSEIVMEALTQAGAPAGVFGHIFGIEAGRKAITDERIRAASFTGSLRAGRALFDLANQRPTPIPFYGELGSVNPVFVTVGAHDQAEEIADGFVSSFTLGSGQFCTKPGVIFVPAQGAILDILQDRALPAVAPLLNDNIVAGFTSATGALEAHPKVSLFGVARGQAEQEAGLSASLFSIDIADLLQDFDVLTEERFGPTALIVTYRQESELLQAARAFTGQLTASLFAHEEEGVVPELLEILTDRAGRILWNQWPTGVSVTYAQQHGGPYPATTAVGTTSVGTAAISRFLRPIAFQNFPASLLPESLRDDSDVPQMVDGEPAK